MFSDGSAKTSACCTKREKRLSQSPQIAYLRKELEIVVHIPQS